MYKYMMLHFQEMTRLTKKDVSFLPNIMFFIEIM